MSSQLSNNLNNLNNLNNSKTIALNGEKYVTIKFMYKNKTVPVVLDYDVYKKIKNFNKNWHINGKGFVVTSHQYNGVKKDIYMHDVVMRLIGNDGNDNNKNTSRPILHINTIGIDNRKCNLMYDDENKEITKNIKKKERTIVLPHENIDPDKIPSYVWYMKENNTHGERFSVDFGDVRWKSTASKKVSLKYKLEETKKYLRHLKNTMGDDFELFSMNGDLNIEGQNLLKSFIEISKIGGFENISNYVFPNNTEYYLKENHDGMTKQEIELLKYFDPSGERIDFRSICCFV